MTRLPDPGGMIWPGLLAKALIVALCWCVKFSLALIVLALFVAWFIFRH